MLRGHLPDVHAYAHDTQVYLSFKPNSDVDQHDAMTQGRPGGVVEYQYTQKKIDKIPQNTPNSSKYTQK